MKSNMVSGMTMALLCFILASGFVTADSVDTIPTNHSISDGETLVSGDGRFELGFFSPGASTSRYVGIWIKKSSNRTVVVWVANRNYPITDSSGVLKVLDSGRIFLSSQGSGDVWSSNVSGPAQNPVAQLLDSGNLVVRNGSYSTNVSAEFLWQSFDHPVDSQLAEMKIGQVGGLDLYLSSWKSKDDPAVGDYTYWFDTKGLEMKVRRGLVVTYRSGPWNGIQFVGRPLQLQNTIFSYKVVLGKKESYFTFDGFVDGSVASRVIVEPYGNVSRDTWIDANKSWNSYQTAPSDICDNYALCGVYGSCDTADLLACSCLDRFVPRSKKSWSQSDWSGGCVRRTPLNCLNDGFIKYSNLKLPDAENATVEAGMTLEMCRRMCSKNCTCTAFSNMNMTDGETRCFLWYNDDIFDIKMLSEDGQDLYLRMASSELDHDNETTTKSNLKKAVGIASGCIALAILLLLATYLYRKKKKQDHGKRAAALGCISTSQGQKEDVDLPLFDLETIAHATANFSISNKLGEGGFGPVYKGVLKDGQEIAAKRLSKYSRQGPDEFRNEVVNIARLQHRNLVKLLGCCIDVDEKILIYEFMPNKSLDAFIFDERQLDWLQRFDIVKGIARGLLYLHQDSRFRIVHRDLKASNVLLDRKMNPKISDFGLARCLAADDETKAKTKNVVGTYGYMSPEYAIAGRYSTKSDVFSFGVIALEIVSGKRNRGFSHPDHHLNLLGHAWRLFKEGRSLELAAKAVGESDSIPEIERVIQVGLLCVQRNTEDRPSMSAVVLMLGSEATPLPQPKQPGFFSEMDLPGVESPLPCQNQQFSACEVSFSLSHGR